MTIPLKNASTIIEWNNLDLYPRKSETFRFLKAIFLSSYDHLRTLFIIVIALEEFVLLEDLDLAQVSQESMVSKIH